ncbi:MAG: hypothetical protein KAV82_11200 [Phycisphaerae bacterium]|nr:hypothetical protein [Phycisphaerae bacterium]
MMLLVGAVVRAGPEEQRFDAAKFRAGLQQRGLTELLDLYLHEVPPADEVAALLLERDIRLAEYADQTRNGVERRKALLASNRLLERLIREHSADLRAFDWRLQLGQSLLYEEAAPFCTSILYRGGSAEDRAELADVMERAGRVFRELRIEVDREMDRLEELPARAYEQLELAGHIQRIENLGPLAEYMGRWARFYQALARVPSDRRRTAELDEVLDDLKNHTGLLESPHAVTHVQAQSLLLAGMVSRRLGDHLVAMDYLDSARTTVHRLTSTAEREDLKWVEQLALLETIRAYSDSHLFQRAERALREFGEYLDTVAPDDFGLRLVAALAESKVRRKQAARARAAGDRRAAERFENMRFEPLMQLARQRAGYRDEIYATLYDLMGASTAPAGLHPFEGCALLAGLLNDTATLDTEIATARAEGDAVLSSRIEGLQSRRIAVLDRAISVARHFYESPARVPPGLLPEIVYNLGVAYLQRGHRFEAARAFIEVGHDHRRFRHARLSAVAAVQVASRMAQDPSLRDRADIQKLYLDALETLAENFPSSDDARYWQFFLAQLLDDLGRHDEAASAFAEVDSSHEYHLYAGFLRIRALAVGLGEFAATEQADSAESARRVRQVVEAAKAFIEQSKGVLPEGSDAAVLEGFQAEAELLAAEALLSLGKDRAFKALGFLEGFEQRYPGQRHLLGRVLRTRIIAYEHLGRLDDAEKILPDYIRSDPEHAGATLQALFESIREDIARLQRRGRQKAADRKAASALLLARQIHRWASGDPSRVGPEQKYAIDVQLAQALLQARRYAEAERAFAACLAADVKRNPNGGSNDLRAVTGHAESLYHLGRHEEALPLFYRLCQRLPSGEAMWFRALLRDLQCRTQLGHPPEGIIKVIRQQKFLHNDMGGPELHHQFDALLHRNENRMPAGAK